jgi:hypothetical protein
VLDEPARELQPAFFDRSIQRLGPRSRSQLKGTEALDLLLAEAAKQVQAQHAVGISVRSAHGRRGFALAHMRPTFPDSPWHRLGRDRREPQVCGYRGARR